MLFCILCLAFNFVCVKAQSTNIEFPTAVTTNEIKGKIAARDVGDSRLTSHYYYFNGTQGDIFIKILTSNLEGDIDIFIADTLRPVTKISVYSDSSTETGREIYLRKPEKLLLRVEGRTPIDESANYSIKFEGSFLAAMPKKESEDSKLPVVKSETEGIVKVNSVGTIIKTPNKIITPKTTVAKTPVKTPNKTPNKTTTVPKSVSTIENKPETEKIENSTTSKTETTEKPEVVITEDLPKETPPETAAAKTAKPSKKIKPKKKTTTKPVTEANTPVTGENTEIVSKPTAKEKALPKPTTAQELAKALENVKLIILLKDGTQVERPMNEVLRVNVINGMLTVTAKDGSIRRYSILDITKMSIE